MAKKNQDEVVSIEPVRGRLDQSLLVKNIAVTRLDSLLSKALGPEGMRTDVTIEELRSCVEVERISWEDFEIRITIPITSRPHEHFEYYRRKNEKKERVRRIEGRRALPVSELLHALHHDIDWVNILSKLR